MYNQSQCQNKIFTKIKIPEAAGRGVSIFVFHV